MVAFRFTPLAGDAPRSLTVNVSRYTPQAVLVANVEEARYDALLGEDGKILVRARYAVRNNQRSFLAVVLPAQADACGARRSRDGRCVPASPPTAALLLPLQKGRTGEEAPLFFVEARLPAAWRRVDRERGGAHRSARQPICRCRAAGLTLHYSPRYAVDAHPGAFRVDQRSRLLDRRCANLSTALPQARRRPTQRRTSRR